MNNKLNYMNWRSLKIVSIGLTSYLLVMVLINTLVIKTTPTRNVEDPVTGEQVTIISGESVFEPLTQLLQLGNMIFICCSALVVSFGAIKIFCKNTAGKHAKTDSFDRGWEYLPQSEKTRWSLAIIVFLAGCLIVGSAKGAENPLPISINGYNLIVKYEVSNKSYYNAKLQRPSVPAPRTTQSGVTVGFGYDCGYKTQVQIERDWGGVLSRNEVRALQSVCGLKGMRAYYANRNIMNRVRVTWSQAEYVFKRTTIPRFSKTTRQAFSLDKHDLHPDCNAALVSLVFNRGASMGARQYRHLPAAFDRRMEMRWVKHNISIGKEYRVPSNIRHMKRLWSRTKLRGLHLRRDAEADLFHKGLSAMSS